MHRDPSVTPGGLPDSASVTARSHSERYRGPSLIASPGVCPEEPARRREGAELSGMDQYEMVKTAHRVYKKSIRPIG